MFSFFRNKQSQAATQGAPRVLSHDEDWAQYHAAERERIEREERERQEAMKRINEERAAEIAGVARADFIEALAERQIDVVQIDPDELEQEVNRARSSRR